MGRPYNCVSRFNYLIVFREWRTNRKACFLDYKYMNKLLTGAIFSLLVLFGHSALLQANQTVRLSEPVSADSTSETFGAPLDVNEAKIGLTELINNAPTHLNQSFRVETKIAKVCQKKGCFFIAQENDTVVRVSFKDYGFFIPSDSSGKTVELNAELIQKEITPAQAEHFAEDLKTQNSPVKAGVTYELVASSVKIPL